MNITKRLIFILLIVLVTSGVIAQEKHQIPVDFFEGKWAGEIKGYAIAHDCEKGNRTVNFSIDLISYESHGDAGETIILPFKAKGVYMFWFMGGITPNASVAEDGKAYYVTPLFVHLRFHFSESELTPVTDQWILGLYFLVLIDDNKSNNRIDLKNRLVKIQHKQEEYCHCGGFSLALVYSGEIYQLDKNRVYFPKDIKPNEPIKTDKKTQLEITMPSNDVINVAQNTEAVIRSESLMEIMKGKIHGLIKKLKPNTKFEIHTPTSVTSVRGTEYELNVEDDGTTTVIVLDGEVEFSDKENKKTVIVKKNQISVCKPKDLPSDPYEINQDQLLKWWK